MRSFQITETGTFMARLLSDQTFDSFLLREASLHTAWHWTIDGHLNESFFPKDVWADPAQRPYEYARWEDVRPYCHGIIKGRTAPTGFTFVFQLKPEHMEAVFRKAQLPTLSETVGSLQLTIRYEGGWVQVLTGTSMKSFTLDKSADRLWDDTMQTFLAAKKIAFETE